MTAHRMQRPCLTIVVLAFLVSFAPARAIAQTDGGEPPAGTPSEPNVPSEEAAPAPSEEAAPAPSEEAAPAPTEEAAPAPSEAAAPAPTVEAAPAPVVEPPPPSPETPPVVAVPGTPAEPSAGPAAVGQQATSPEAGAPPVDREAYKSWLQTALGTLREKALDKIRMKLEATQGERIGQMTSILLVMGCGGVFLLFAPFVLVRRYPGKFLLLFKYSAIAAVTFTASVWLFTGVLVTLRMVQVGVGEIANPQFAMIDGAVDGLLGDLDAVVDIGPMLLEAPLAMMEKGEQENLPVAMLQNATALMKDAQVFIRIAGWFKGLSVVFGYFPIALLIMAIGLFVVTIKDVLAGIIKLPALAAAGKVDMGAAVKTVFKSIGREALATLVFIVALVATTILTGTLLAYTVAPAMEAFLSYFVLTVVYLLAIPSAETWYVYASLGGTVIFLALSIAVVLVANVAFLARLQKILRRKFHNKEPLSTHKRFFAWAVPGLVWAQALPFAFVKIAEWLVEWIADKYTPAQNADPASAAWAMLLLSGPLILVIGFPLFYWAIRGFRAIGFMIRYKVEAPTMQIAG